jgi:ribosomal 50S subunit-recycling heat shock protein
MLINQEWSAPKKVEYGKNIQLRFSKPGFSVRVFSADGTTREQEITAGKEYEIRANEINAISHPHISFKAHSKEEIHVRVEDPVY